MKKTIITVVGKDTVGIIARVCTYLADNQINILDISQTIVQVTVYFVIWKQRCMNRNHHPDDKQRSHKTAQLPFHTLTGKRCHD